MDVTRFSLEYVSAVLIASHITLPPHLMKPKVIEAKRLCLFFKRYLNYEHLKNYLKQADRGDLRFQFSKHDKRNEIKLNFEV